VARWFMLDLRLRPLRHDLTPRSATGWCMARVGLYSQGRPFRRFFRAHPGELTWARASATPHRAQPAAPRLVGGLPAGVMDEYQTGRCANDPSGWEGRKASPTYERIVFFFFFFFALAVDRRTSTARVCVEAYCQQNLHRRPLLPPILTRRRGTCSLQTAPAERRRAARPTRRVHRFGGDRNRLRGHAPRHDLVPAGAMTRRTRRASCRAMKGVGFLSRGADSRGCFEPHRAVLPRTQEVWRAQSPCRVSRQGRDHVLRSEKSL